MSQRKSPSPSDLYFVVPSASRLFILWLSHELILTLQQLVCELNSHHPQDARHPPAARHDDPAGRPAALVVVGPGVVAPQGLADLLAVGVAPPTLDTADAFVVQARVECHAFPFLLLQNKKKRMTCVFFLMRGLQLIFKGDPECFTATRDQHNFL